MEAVGEEPGLLGVVHTQASFKLWVKLWKSVRTGQFERVDDYFDGCVVQWLLSLRDLKSMDELRKLMQVIQRVNVDNQIQEHKWQTGCEPHHRTETSSSTSWNWTMKYSWTEFCRVKHQVCTYQFPHTSLHSWINRSTECVDESLGKRNQRFWGSDTKSSLTALTDYVDLYNIKPHFSLQH